MVLRGLPVLLLVVLVSGCLGGGDTQASLGPDASGTGADAPTGGNDGSVDASGNPDADAAPVVLRIEDLPLPTNVSGGQVIQVPGGAARMVFLVADTNFTVSDTSHTGPGDPHHWMLLWPRDGNQTLANTCGGLLPTMHIWSSLIDDDNPDWPTIPAGEYILIVGDPDGESMRVAFNNADIGVGSPLHADTRARDYNASTVDVTIAAEGILSRNVTLNATFDPDQVALVSGELRTGASHERGLRTALRLSDATGAVCDSSGVQTAAGGINNQASTRATVQAAIPADAPGPLTLSGWHEGNFAVRPRESAQLVYFTYDGDLVHRPFWL